jgi:hypothetical protein
MSESRREFLQGTALTAAVGVAAFTPRVASADSNRLSAFAAGLRGRQGELRQQYLDSVYDDRPASADRALNPHIQALAAGFGAVSTIKDIQELPPEEQAHPEIQRLIGDSATAVGASNFHTRELLEAFLASDDPNRENHLRAAVRGVRLSLPEWPTREGRKNLMVGPLLELERETRPGALVRRVERLVGRLKKVERVTAELEARDEPALLVTDPEVAARAEAGRQRWADELGDAVADDAAEAAVDELPEERPKPKKRTLKLAGILILSIGCSIGGILVLTGLCVVACGAPAGIIVMLLGVAIVGVSLWMGLSLLKKAGKLTERADPEPPEQYARTERVEMPVHGAEGWVETGIQREEGRQLVVRGSGLVRARGAWMADADGNGETAGFDALVPGAPFGALVGCVGDDRFFIGSEGLVPAGPAGALRLAVNQAAPHAPRGYFFADVTVFEPVRG